MKQNGELKQHDGLYKNKQCHHICLLKISATFSPVRKFFIAAFPCKN